MEKENLVVGDDVQNKEDNDDMDADKDKEWDQNKFVLVNNADGVIPNSQRAYMNDVEIIMGVNNVNLVAQETLPATIHLGESGMQLNNDCIDDMVSTFSSLKVESSSTGNERVLDNFESISNPNRIQGDELMHMESSLREQAFTNNNLAEIQDNNSNSKADVLEVYNAPI